MIINPYAFGGGAPPSTIYSFTSATSMAVYDPSDLATLFQDSAGTTPVTADGDPVGLILDQAGNSARDMMQATSGSRPIYRTSGGKAWLENDGTKWMYSRGNSALAFASVNVFSGQRKATGFADYGPIIGHPYASTHSSPFWRWAIQGRVGGPTIGITSGASASRIDTSAPAAAIGTDFIFTFGSYQMYDVSLGSVRARMIRISKVSLGTGSAPGAGDLNTFPNTNVSTLMSHAAGVVPFKGDFYGCVVYDVAVTSQAWIDVAEAWVNARLRVPV